MCKLDWLKYTQHLPVTSLKYHEVTRHTQIPKPHGERPQKGVDPDQAVSHQRRLVGLEAACTEGTRTRQKSTRASSRGQRKEQGNSVETKSQMSARSPLFDAKQWPRYERQKLIRNYQDNYKCRLSSDPFGPTTLHPSKRPCTMRI